MMAQLELPLHTITIVASHSREEAVSKFASNRTVWNRGDMFRIDGDDSIYLISLKDSGKEKLMPGDPKVSLKEIAKWNIERINES